VETQEYDVRDQSPDCFPGQEVKHQGGCSSAWALAAAGAVGDRLCLSNPNMMLTPLRPGGMKVRRVVSAQRVLSCNSDGLGCAGGSVYGAFKAMMGDAGVFLEDTCPYNVQCWNGQRESVVELSSKDDQICDDALRTLPQELWPCACQAQAREMPKCQRLTGIASRVVGYYRLPSLFDDNPRTGTKYKALETVEWMQKELLARGPFVVGFDVYEDFFFFDFASGSVYSCADSGNKVGGHAAVLVGWGKTSGSKPYWVLRNSFVAAFAKSSLTMSVNICLPHSMALALLTPEPLLACRIRLQMAAAALCRVSSSSFRRASTSISASCTSGVSLANFGLKGASESPTRDASSGRF